MNKTTNYDEVIKTARNRVRILQGLVSALDHCQEQIKWSMEVKRDDDGNRIEDENGEYIRVIPDADSYYYGDYEAWKLVIKAITELIDKQ